MNPNDPDDFSAFLRRWPQTAHLAERLHPFRFERADGVPDVGIRTEEVIAVMREIVDIVSRLDSPPLDLVAVAIKAAAWLPRVEAFHADPLTVMQSGVN